MVDCRTENSVCTLRTFVSINVITAVIYPFGARFLSRIVARIIT